MKMIFKNNNQQTRGSYHSLMIGACCLLFVVLAKVSFAQIQELSESELDNFTAGQSNLNHKQGRGRSEMVVANDSIISHKQNANTHIEGVVQSNLRAINLSNVSQGDGVNGVNIINDVARNKLSREFYQLNQITQTDRRQGQLGFSEVYGTNVRKSWGNSYHKSANESVFNQLDHVNTHSFSDSTTSFNNASIPKYNPLQNFTINLGEYKFGDINLGTLTLGGLVEDPIFGTDTGIRATIGPVKLLGPAVSLGQLHFEGDDLRLSNVSATLPGVDFGSASVKACLIDACASAGPTHIGTVGNQTITVLDEQGKVFVGANPFKDIDLNVGSGIAAAGKGSISAGPINTTLTATVSLGLGEDALLNGFNTVSQATEGLLDFAGEVFNIDPDDRFTLPRLESPLIPPIEVPISSTPGFSAEFEGTICLSILADCIADQEYSSTYQENIVNNTSLHEENFYSSSETFNEYYDESILVGARLSGAEADLIAMSNGAINTEAVSHVSLKDGAQSNIRVINAMNTAYTLSGNAVNISRNSSSINNQRGSGLSLQQGNIFKQYR